VSSSSCSCSCWVKVVVAFKSVNKRLGNFFPFKSVNKLLETSELELLLVVVVMVVFLFTLLNGNF